MSKLTQADVLLNEHAELTMNEGNQYARYRDVGTVYGREYSVRSDGVKLPKFSKDVVDGRRVSEVFETLSMHRYGLLSELENPSEHPNRRHTGTMNRREVEERIEKVEKALSACQRLLSSSDELVQMIEELG